MKTVTVTSMTIAKHGTYVYLSHRPNDVWYIVPGAADVFFGYANRKMLYFVGFHDQKEVVDVLKSSPLIDSNTKLVLDDYPVIETAWVRFWGYGTAIKKPLLPHKTKVEATSIQTSFTDLRL